MDIQRYFRILNLDRSASLDDLKKVYRTQVKVWHPDRMSERDPQVRQKAEEKLKEINVAYNGLRSYFSSKHQKDEETWSKGKIKPENGETSTKRTTLDRHNRGYVLTRGRIFSIITILALGCFLVGYYAIITNRINEQNRHAYTGEFQKYHKDEVKFAGSEVRKTKHVSRSNEIESIFRQAMDAFQQKRFAYSVTLQEDILRDNLGYFPEVEDLYVQGLQEWAASLFDTEPHKAQALLSKAIKLRPENAVTHFYLGKLNTKLKNYPQAIAYYNKSIDLDPSYHRSLFNLGFVYAMTMDYPSAEQTIRKLVSLYPPYLDEAYFNLAMVQRAQGKHIESIGNLERALAFNSKNLKAKKYLLRFKRKPGSS